VDILLKFIDDAQIETKEFLDYVMDTDEEDLAEFISLLNDIIDRSYSQADPDTGFTFVANSTLSGRSFPCGEIECKLDNVVSLARNAILYADTVYIQNPFEVYSNSKGFNEKLRFDVVNDLVLLGVIKPLLKSGIFKIAKSKVHYCHNCYERFQETYLKTRDWNLDVIKPLIADYLAHNIEFKVFTVHGTTGVKISGGNDLLKHPMVLNFVQYVPDEFKKYVKEGEEFSISAQEAAEGGLINHLSAEVEMNLSVQDYYSSYYSAHVLTDREFDIKLSRLLNKNADNELINRSETLKNLAHLVPFVDDVSIEKLLKLRASEGDAFQVYRDKLNKVVKNVNINEKESRQLYLDEIQPEINKINLTLSNNKKLLWGNIKSNIFLASTYISTSLFTGILPTNIDKVVASIGGFGFAKSISQDILSLIKQPEVKKNELYFLWRVQQERSNKI
jgi:hypothetical protein